MITAFIRIAPHYASRLVLDETLRREGRTLYQAGCMKTHGEVPLLINHDDTMRVGTVRPEIIRHADTDGIWHCVLADITDPPEWLRVGSSASIGYIALSRTSANGCERILSALLREVSVLTPATRPAEPRAAVLTLGIARTAQVGARPRSRSKAAYSDKQSRPTLLVRPIGQVIGIR